MIQTQELRSLEDVARMGNGQAAGLKEHGAKAINPHFDIPPYLVGFRGENGRAGLLIEVICDGVDRDKGLQAVFSLAAMECVAIACTFDAHITSSMTNPRTGKEWERGEMQGLCDGEGACDTGLLTDCLMTTAVFADGTVAGFSRPYHVHEAKAEIGWINDGEPLTGTKDALLTGYIVDTMRDMMKQGRTRSALLSSGLAALAAGIEMPVEAMAHRDAVVIRSLADEGCIVRVAREIAKTPAEHAIIQRVVSRSENISWLR